MCVCVEGGGPLPPSGDLEDRKHLFGGRRVERRALRWTRAAALCRHQPGRDWPMLCRDGACPRQLDSRHCGRGGLARWRLIVDWLNATAALNRCLPLSLSCHYLSLSVSLFLSLSFSLSLFLSLSFSISLCMSA